VLTFLWKRPVRPVFVLAAVALAVFAVAVRADGEWAITIGLAVYALLAWYLPPIGVRSHDAHKSGIQRLREKHRSS
jgi:hypothetical protein